MQLSGLCFDGPNDQGNNKEQGIEVARRKPRDTESVVFSLFERINEPRE